MAKSQSYVQILPALFEAMARPDLAALGWDHADRRLARGGSPEQRRGFSVLEAFASNRGQLYAVVDFRELRMHVFCDDPRQGGSSSCEKDLVIPPAWRRKIEESRWPIQETAFGCRYASCPYRGMRDAPSAGE